jgi:branched-chain amino acid transport system ATP-binding protein
VKPLLRVENLAVRYGRISALHGISIEVGVGEVIGLIGPNGAGKTTTLSAIVGLLTPSAGTIVFDGQDLIRQRPDAIVKRGIALVPEGRQIFGTLSVEENLRLGMTPRQDRDEAERDLERVFERFPILGKYFRSSAGKLSGGEQQQLAIARALLSRPRLLLLDEPSLGLAPRMVDLVFQVLADLRDDGTTILLVEQNARRTIKFADRTYVLRSGQLTLSGTRDELTKRSDLVEAYLGL